VNGVLGDENGIECAHKIKARSPSTRIVLVSSDPYREYHRLARDAGAVAVLPKRDLNAATLHEIMNDLTI
jgi:DNA-binding NarL/FixJ family response regulator